MLTLESVVYWGWDKMFTSLDLGLITKEIKCHNLNVYFVKSMLQDT